MFLNLLPDGLPEPPAPQGKSVNEPLPVCRFAEHLLPLQGHEPCMDFAGDKVVIMPDIGVKRAFLDRVPKFCLLHEGNAFLPQGRIFLLHHSVPEMRVLVKRDACRALLWVEVDDASFKKAIDMGIMVSREEQGCLFVEVIRVAGNTLADAVLLGMDFLHGQAALLLPRVLALEGLLHDFAGVLYAGKHLLEIGRSFKECLGCCFQLGKLILCVSGFLPFADGSNLCLVVTDNADNPM